MAELMHESIVLWGACTRSS